MDSALKNALLAFAGFVAVVWILCGYLFWSPLDSKKQAGAPPLAPATIPMRAAMPKPDAANTTALPGPTVRSMAIPTETGDTSATVAVPAPSSITLGSVSSDQRDLEVGEKWRVMAGRAAQAADPAAMTPPLTVPSANPAQQLTSSGNYILDGDSIVVAPQVTADEPDSPAAQRRRARMSTDIGKIP